MISYTLKVFEIKRETKDTITLCFKQPGLRKIKYKAGQYLTLIFRINGRRYIRPYSFSSCPGVDELLEITVKRVVGGIVSNHIHDEINVGDSIESFSPMGDFIYHENDDLTDIYLWAVGSGITPLMSLLKYILSTKENSKVYLNLGNRNYEQTIFLEHIEKLREKHTEKFFVKYFHTEYLLDQDNPTVIKGRIDQVKALRILKENINLESSAHYICGPVGIKESVKQALDVCGVNSINIFSEDFDLVKDPKDFEDIHTQHVTLNYEGIDYPLEVIKGQSILETGLNSGIELPYSCQTGNCSTCKGKLKEGKLKMIGLQKERNDLNNDEYLLCCSYPLSNDVYLEV